MSKKSKLLEKIRDRERNFNYNELKRFLAGHGYTEDTAGKTSGSRVHFVSDSGDVISIHKPHNSVDLLKECQKDIRNKLKKEGLI